MRYAAVALALFALATGLAGAWYWYKSSVKVPAHEAVKIFFPAGAREPVYAPIIARPTDRWSPAGRGGGGGDVDR